MGLSRAIRSNCSRPRPGSTRCWMRSNSQCKGPIEAALPLRDIRLAPNDPNGEAAMESRMAQVRTEIIPYIYYSDVAAALEWLARAFGFKEDMRTATPSGGVHGEMNLDGQHIMLGQRPG